MNNKNILILGILSYSFFGYLAYSQELVLTMDQECEKLAKYQIVGSSLFYKILLKKTFDLNAFIRESGITDETPVCKFHFDLNNPPEYLVITTVKKDNSYNLQIHTFSHEKLSDNPVIVSISGDVNVNYKTAVKSLILGVNTQGRINLFDNLHSRGQMSIGQITNSGGPGQATSSASIPTPPNSDKNSDAQANCELIFVIDSSSGGVAPQQSELRSDAIDSPKH